MILNLSAKNIYIFTAVFTECKYALAAIIELDCPACFWKEFFGICLVPGDLTDSFVLHDNF